MPTILDKDDKMSLRQKEEHKSLKIDLGKVI